jgi:hypothetical protein
MSITEINMSYDARAIIDNSETPQPNNNTVQIDSALPAPVDVRLGEAMEKDAVDRVGMSTP